MRLLTQKNSGVAGSFMLCFLSMLVVIFVTSCSEDSPTPPPGGGSGIEDLSIGDDFDYNTLQDVHLEITVLDFINNPMQGVKIFTFDAPPSDDNPDPELLVSGRTGNDGVFTMDFKPPSYLDSIYVKANVIGMFARAVIPVGDGNISFTFGGEPEEEISSDGPDYRPEKWESSRLSGADVDYVYLGGGYDANGRPHGREQHRDYFEQDFLDNLAETFVEGEDLRDNHPDYIANDAEANILVSGEAEVFVSFVHDGTDYQNALGFYTYTDGDPPESAEDIEEHIIIFPNASFFRQGGMLHGDKMSLGVHPANTVIGWFLVSDGWVRREREVQDGRGIFYSNTALNPEDDDDLKRHIVFGYHGAEDFYIMTFEDVQRDFEFCDHDFNDVIFAITADPPENIEAGGIPNFEPNPDTDNDGVLNDEDDYPEDADKAFNNYFPGENTFGRIAYEDNWPKKGDYDFNDLVVAYRINQITNADNDAVEIVGEFDIKAVGAGYKNAFGFELPIVPGGVESVSGTSIEGDLVTLSGNGTEAGQSNAVIIVFDNTRNLVTPSGGEYDFVNTEPGAPLIDADMLTVTVLLSSPVDPGDLGSPPYNPFLIINQERGYEVHLAGYEPTDLANADHFGTYDDTSVPANGRYYKTVNNLPWALLLPGDWQHVIEKEQFMRAYLYFAAWAESDGAAHDDWYLDNQGNIDFNYIWSAP